LTKPLSGQFVVRKLGLATIKLHTKFQFSMFTHFDYTKGNAKCKIWGGLEGGVRGPNQKKTT